jgi:WS/DGAT/MGAT family acyltransferase
MALTFARSLLAPMRSMQPIFRAFATVAPAIVERFMDVVRHPDHAVVTRFNSVVSPHRVFDTRRFPMEEFDEVRTLVAGASVDDVVFAMCGGALRRYLDAQGELPEGGLTATTPLALDMAGDDVADFSWTRVRLGSDINDPLARLEMIREQTSAWKKGSDRPDAYDLSDVARYSPGATIAVTSKMLSYASAQLGRWAPLANCAIASVPGPDAPLYLQGARLTYYSAIMPISDGMGLVFAVTTYDGKIIVSFTSCYELLPDPEFFAQCLRDVFQDYLALARAKQKGKSSKHPGSGPRRKAVRAA